MVKILPIANSQPHNVNNKSTFISLSHRSINFNSRAKQQNIQTPKQYKRPHHQNAKQINQHIMVSYSPFET